MRRRTSPVIAARVVETQSGEVLYQLEEALPSPDDQSAVRDVRERVAGAVLALSDTMFPAWRVGRSRPPRYDAYLAFKQATDALWQQGEAKAIEHMRRAMTLDPEFPQAKLWYMEQAIGWPSERAFFDSVRAVLEAQRPGLPPYDQAAIDRQLAFTDGRLEDAYTAARQLVALAPSLPDALSLLAQASLATRRYREGIEVLHKLRKAPAWIRGMDQRLGWDLQAHRLLGDLETGIAEWQAAVREQPDEWVTCSQGIPLLGATGQVTVTDSVIRHCGRLPNAPPRLDGTWITAGRNYRVAGRVGAADSAFRRTLEMRSALVAKGTIRASALAPVYADLGEWSAAWELLRAAPDDGEEDRRSLAAVAAAHAGDTLVARRLLSDLRRGKRRSGANMYAAFVQLALGERDSALASLRLAMEDGVAPAWNGWYVRPELHALRGDPRFEEMLRPR